MYYFDMINNENILLYLCIFEHTVGFVGSQFPDQGSNLGPLYGVLTTGQPGNSQEYVAL